MKFIFLIVIFYIIKLIHSFEIGKKDEILDKKKTKFLGKNISNEKLKDNKNINEKLNISNKQKTENPKIKIGKDSKIVSKNLSEDQVILNLFASM